LKVAHLSRSDLYSPPSQRTPDPVVTFHIETTKVLKTDDPSYRSGLSFREFNLSERKPVWDFMSQSVSLNASVTTNSLKRVIMPL